MCSFVAGVGTALEIGGNYLGQRAAYKQAQAQIDAQAKAAITQMNYAFQNYEQERTDALMVRSLRLCRLVLMHNSSIVL